ncbi:MAG TPA: hypothetical protein VGS07_32115 [Thermoanaerobaculia bacterium]|jgi:hypothetical protein|nr:hypothetical protein [Thermoanaerobaculia bacterium]
MSVLSFPRIYFQGYMQWDVCTSNNNDYVPVYDAANAALDWAFLGQLQPPITPDNFRDEFRPWAIEPYKDSCPSPDDVSDNCSSDPSTHMPSRWNFYGGQGCGFIQHPNARSLSSGGDVAYNQPALPTDAILQKPVEILGNTIGGRISPARLIDINPASPFCSQIYLSSFKVGDAQTYLGGAVSQRMYSRSFFVPRNIDPKLMIAGPIGAIFQTTIPKASLQTAGNSALVNALVAAAGEENAAGVMLRFATYNTVYYKNGTFNDIAEQPTNCAQLTALYQQGKVFINPAYSRVVGVLGVWNQGELATAPGGHMLVPNMALKPAPPPSPAMVRAAVPIGAVGHTALQFEPGADVRATTSELPPLAPGVIHAEINDTAGIVSLDLQNAIPEFTLDADLQAERYDYGLIDVGVLLPDKTTFNLIGSFDYNQYNKAAYSAKGGLVDVPFGPDVDAGKISGWLEAGNGVLALRAQGQILSVETPLTIETDDRGVYVDQGETQRITLQVRYKNALPPAGTQVFVFQYFPWLLKLGSGSWSLFNSTPPPPSPEPAPVCNVLPASPFLSIPQFWLTVDGQGNAGFNITSQAPGFPILVYYPMTGTSVTAQTPVGFGFTPPPGISIGTSFYSVARVLPFDNALVSQFADCWNGTGIYEGQPKHDRLQAWRFVYSNILYVYDMIFPVMDLFMPLGDLVRVEGAIDQLMVMITEDMETASTLYMPVTRDLSAGKRQILETWGGLVVRKYPPVDI